MESKDYLEEGFDPKVLKVANLRGILNEHGVQYPSNSKKRDLINTFNKEIKPRAQELLEKYKTANSPKGDFIKNGGSESESRLQSGERTNPRTPTNSKTISSPIMLSEKQERSSKKSPIMSPDAEPPLSSRKRKFPNEISKVSSSSKKVKSRSVPKKSLFDDSESSDSSFSVTSRGTPKAIKPNYPAFKPENSSMTKSKIQGKSDFQHSDDSVYDISSSKENRDSDSNPKDSQSSVKESSEVKHSPHEKTQEKSSSLKKEEIMIGTKDFGSLQDEQDDFDKQLKELKRNPEVNSLSSNLGITVHGLPPQGYVLSEKSFESPSSPSSITKRPSPESSKKKMPVIKHIPRKTHIEEPILEGISSVSSETDEQDSENTSSASISELSDIEPHYEEGKSSYSTADSFKKVKEDIHKDFVRSQIGSKKPNTSISRIMCFIVLWFIIISGALFAYWYREQKILVGFCGQEINIPTFPARARSSEVFTRVGKYLDINFKPDCKPCPPHSRCFPYLEMGCYEDFVEMKSWISIIDPTLKKCVPDTRKAEKLDAMISVALDLLRTKNAYENCGKASFDKSDAGISTDELHDLLLFMKAPYITSEEFEDLWNRSITELKKEPEIIQVPRLNHPSSNKFNVNNTAEKNENEIFRSTSLSNLSLKCQVQNSILQTIIQFRLFIGSTLLAILFYKLASMKYREKRLQEIRTDIVFREVLKRLSKQKKDSRSNTLIPSYIGTSHLRDLILTSEKKLNKRMAFWNKVSKKVEANSNVRSKLVENHGEIFKVWEWISDIDI